MLGRQDLLDGNIPNHFDSMVIIVQWPGSIDVFFCPPEFLEFEVQFY